MKICICGGGNISHALAGDLACNKENEITVLTRRPKDWALSIDVYSGEDYKYSSEINYVTDDFSVLNNIDMVIITIPSHARLDYIKKISQYLNKDALIVVAPSTGGINFILEQYCPKNKYICMQRTPYISRIIEYGHSVNLEKKKIVDVYLSANANKDDLLKLESLLGMKLNRLKTFWTLVLSNSNPILHIVAMCTLLDGDYPYSENQYLYDTGWNDSTSELALNMDNELQLIMDRLGVSEYRSLLKHYDVNDKYELTAKLKSIPSFKTLLAPLKDVDGKYYIDEKSRYVIEDLPYGTCFIKVMGQLLNIKTPYVDYSIRKLQPLIGLQLLDENNDLDIKLWEKLVSFDFYSTLKNMEY